MNKTVIIIFLALIASIIAVWYKAHHPTPMQAIDPNSLIVGTNAEYAPFSFMKDGIISGFDIDLIHEVAARLGKTIQMHDMPFDALIPALQTGTIQIIAAGITPTPERAERVIFTKPYLTGDQLAIVTPASKPLETLEQLKDKTVTVNEGFTADYFMSKVEGPQLIRFATPLESFMALESGRADAFVAAHNTVTPFIEHYGAQKFSVAPIPETNDEYALAISKRYPELLEPIQEALDAIAADGTLQKLKEKWKLS